jgi:RNA polymerase sigma-70 factor (ECF subfamily)
MVLSAGVVTKESLVSFLDHALPEVYGYLLHRTQEKMVAEDLTSETMIAAVGGMIGSPTERLSVPWLIGIARHKLADHWRREARDRRRFEMIVAQRASEPTDVVFEEGPAFETLALLSPSQRLALTLRYVDGLSVPEVAELVGRSVHATETLLVRSRCAFKDRYAEIGGVDA